MSYVSRKFTRGLRAFALLSAFLAFVDTRPALLEDLRVETSLAAIGTCPRTDPNYPTCRPPTDCSRRATVSLRASPADIRQGDTAIVRWSVGLPTNCRSLTLTLNGQRVAVSGSREITPKSTTRYTLKLGAVALANATVTVGLPRTVRIEGSSSEWRRLLVQAVGTSNTVVLLRHDVDMDLTGESEIPFGVNVTLMSEAPQVASLGRGGGSATASWFARDARHLGPRLYTRGYPERLFYIRCDHGSGENARLLGFRLQGPSVGVEDDRQSGGVMFYACRKAEVGHMEISGWAGWGIAVRDTAPPRVVRPDGLWIHDNFIHHNENKNAPGYGIDVQARGYALIERNVFDFNRHAITAAGTPGTSYNARHNLVLRGGGVHGDLWNRFTHQFDVHGDNHCNPAKIPLFLLGIPVGDDIPIYDESWYNCGNAGSSVAITSNAFQYRVDRAIKLRGKPTQGASVYDNVFAHDSLNDAVTPLDDLDVRVARNTIKADTFGRYGVCDFDGDGRDDLFLATGAGWWYAAGGRMHWTFLAPHTERLHEVGLGDFTGDGRCDVFAVRYRQWAISDGATDPWRILPDDYTDIPFDELAFGDFNGDRQQDIFRRAPNGDWSAISPGVYEWMNLARSSIPLGGLRFGDFDGDGVTDVLSRSGGVWSISRGGQTGWLPLPAGLTDDVAALLIGDVDGIAGDDMLRFVPIDRHTARWEVSSSGMTPWQTFATMEWPVLPAHGPLAETVFSFVGRFDSARGADLLFVDRFRMSRIRSADETFRPHGLYAH